MKRSLRIRYALFSMMLLMVNPASFAQRNPVQGGKPDPQLSQSDNDFIDRQDALFLDSVQTVIKSHPPVAREGKDRGYAKLLLDAVFHDKYAAFRKPVVDWFHRRGNEAISGLESKTDPVGMRIWKIYNMGFIVRTQSVTIAFDLVSGSTSGSPSFALNQQELEKIVGKCDLLFISHKHEDHAEKAIVSLFLKAGKPVIAPEQLWRGDTVSSFIQHPEREGNKVQSVRLKGGTTLSYKVFPGHQMESIDNNVYLVTTPEGYTIAHTGDEINEGKFMIDFDWIDEVYKSNTVDLLLPNAWTMDIQRIVKGFNPGLVMPGHELELGHTVWDRLPYWGDDAYLQLNYAALKKSSYPVVPLIWGESYRYVPKRFETAPVKSTPRKKRR